MRALRAGWAGEGGYFQAILLTAIVVAAALPLFYYKNRVVDWFGGKS